MNIERQVHRVIRHSESYQLHALHFGDCNNPEEMKHTLRTHIY